MRLLIPSLAAALLLGGGVFVWKNRHPGDAPPSTGADRAEARGTERTAGAPSVDRRPRPDPRPEWTEERSTEELTELRERIYDLTTTYEASAIPDLVGFLDDPSPAIRAEAREGIRQLGEKAAVPYLLKAAKEAPNPAEAVELEEIARWLELPPASGERR